ncbi:MAG: hypothetical protein IBJ09_08300 [Bacteroidia bacterium]|nr:hypothetical protein [Bacteroidia bacterium]
MKKLKNTQHIETGFHAVKMGDLLYFEGPLISLFADKHNPDTYYLYKWADRDSRANRWLVLRLSSQELLLFFNAGISLLELIRNAGTVWLMDMNSALEVSGMVSSPVPDLPAEYLPAAGAYYSEGAYTMFASAFHSTLQKAFVS